MKKRDVRMSEFERSLTTRLQAAAEQIAPSGSWGAIERRARRERRVPALVGAGIAAVVITVAVAITTLPNFDRDVSLIPPAQSATHDAESVDYPNLGIPLVAQNNGAQVTIDVPLDSGTVRIQYPPESPLDGLTVLAAPTTTPVIPNAAGTPSARFTREPPSDLAERYCTNSNNETCEVTSRRLDDKSLVVAADNSRDHLMLITKQGWTLELRGSTPNLTDTVAAEVDWRVDADDRLPVLLVENETVTLLDQGGALLYFLADDHLADVADSASSTVATLAVVPDETCSSADGGQPRELTASHVVWCTDGFRLDFTFFHPGGNDTQAILLELARSLTATPLDR